MKKYGFTLHGSRKFWRRATSASSGMTRLFMGPGGQSNVDHRLLRDDKNPLRGFTLIELLVVIGITSLIVSLGLSNFRRYQAQRSVEGALEITLAQITRAHLDTISSRNDTSYGVHLESDRITYFPGTSFDPNDPRDIAQYLPNGTELVNLSLNGGGSDIMFKRVTGDTNQSGTFTLRSTSYPDTMKIITVNAIGTIVY